MKRHITALLIFILLFSNLQLFILPPRQNTTILAESDIIQEFGDEVNVQNTDIMKNINKLDGFFTANYGQIGDESVRYFIHGKGVWFLDDGVVFELTESVQVRSSESGASMELFNKPFPGFESDVIEPTKSVAIKINFEGCNEVKPIGIEQLPHRSNFFYGNDSSKWCTNVPNYREIIYENIYDDIDLKYYNSNDGLKYDFIVNPSGDPNNIRLSFNGVEKTYINSDGNLIIYTPMGELIDSKLFIYQQEFNSRIEIIGSFRLLDSNTYGFEIQNIYDKNKPLIIDPLLYSTYIGGTWNDVPFGITADSGGNAYITGRTRSVDYPTTTGSFDETHNNNRDIFVSKINPKGTAFVYSTYVGGGGGERGFGIAVNSNGHAYVAGGTASLDFPVTPNVYSNASIGGDDAVVFKLNETGSSLLYSTYIGGTDGDGGYDIAIDYLGNAYVSGALKSNDFPITSNTFDSTYNGGECDVFVAKLNPTGSNLLYSTYLGGSFMEWGLGIVSDPNGFAYVTGLTGSKEFPTTPDAYDTDVYFLTYDVFVTKLDTNGPNLVYSTFLGGNSYDEGHGIAIDDQGNAYVAGLTESTDYPTTDNAYDRTYNGNRDAFIFKLNATGSSLIYSTYIGGNSWDWGEDIAIDTSGNAYVTGWTGSLDFPTTMNAYCNKNKGCYDVFVFTLNQTGSNLLYSSYIGGNSDDYGNSIAVDPENNVYVTGLTHSYDFPNTTNAISNNNSNSEEGYVFKLGIIPLSPPEIIDLNNSKLAVTRTNPVFIYSNSTDIEDSEQNLSHIYEFRNPTEFWWDNHYFSNLHYNNSRWEIIFTAPINATLGWYDFRVRAIDTDKMFSHWFYFNDSLLVLNNRPQVQNLLLSNNKAIYGDTISLWINGTDIEDPEQNLTIELEYRNPNELSWDTEYLNYGNYSNSRWNANFSIPFNAIFGYYDFRIRFYDTDGDSSGWFYSNNSLLIQNTNPLVVDINQTKFEIYRTDKTLFFVNGSDHETPEEQLNFYIQYKHENKIIWEILEGLYSDLNSNWETIFETDIYSILGVYDFRVKFEDNEGASSGWYYLNHSLEVKNNLPLISDSCDDFLINSNPVHFDLTIYESDIEDSDQDLIWSINQSTVDSSLFSANIVIPSDDIITITPMENVIGSDDITLILTDKDGGIFSKSNITVQVNNTVNIVQSPNYGVSISISPESIELLQDESQSVTLTVKNIGNIRDDYILYYDLFEISDLKIEILSNLISLEPQESRQISVQLTSTENFNLTNDLRLKFFAKSENAINSTPLIISFTDISKDPISDNDLITENDLTLVDSIDNFILVILIIIIILVLMSSMFIGGTEIGKYKFLSIIFIPLYNRLHHDDVLDNFIRGKIYGYILAKPGDHYNSIKKALGLNNGTFVHHVRILEKEKYVISKRDGFFTRFYPAGAKMPIVDEPPLNEIQKKIVENVRENPGITQHEIVTITGTSQQVVSYNLTNLTRENVLKTDLDGREKKYFVNYEELSDVKNQVRPIQPEPSEVKA